MKHNLFFGDLIGEIIENSRGIEKNIAFSDGEDIRTIQALDYFKDVNASRFLLVGNEQKILSHIKEVGISLNDRIEILDPRTSAKRDEYKQIISKSFENRGKSITGPQVDELAEDTSYYVSTMLKNNDADCAIGGSLSSTRALVKSVIHVLGLSQGKNFLSAAAFVDIPDCQFGHRGKFCLADPAIIPQPTEEQLYDITMSAYETAEVVLGVEPRVALLSYSTMGSAKGEDIDRIQNVVKRIRESYPDWIIDGELQFDAAIVPEVAMQKCPTSPLKGGANTLIFPNLDSANICYKAIQRLAKATVCGSLILGTAKPFNDLSRGCPYQDIISLTAMTLMQTKEL